MIIALMTNNTLWVTSRRMVYVFLIALLSGCVSTTGTSTSRANDYRAESNNDARNKNGANGAGLQTLSTGTLTVPSIKVPTFMTQPTAYSKRIRMGSSTRAEDFLCTLMTRYSVILNADFDATLNVFKHRAARMGADWVAIDEHSEVLAATAARDQQPIYLVDGSPLPTEKTTLTRIEGSLYDCR